MLLCNTYILHCPSVHTMHTVHHIYNVDIIDIRWISRPIEWISYFKILVVLFKICPEFQVYRMIKNEVNGLEYICVTTFR